MIIPAAGIGTRMGLETPKQYLQLQGQCIIEHTLKPFCEHEGIEAVVVALAKNDRYWPKLKIAAHPKIHTATGGLERCHSVLNSLNYLHTIAAADDWVMVHDAARPCLRREDIDKLMGAMSGDSEGGLLAIPVRDTMKRTDKTMKIKETVDRENLWHALTPQIFRLGPLKAALESAISQDIIVTDEAQAMEMRGVRPLLVEGHPDNIKITHQNDLPLAELFLAQQENRL